MTVAATTPGLTADEFLALPDERDYELINGMLVRRKETGAEGSYVAGQVMMFLGTYRREHGGWPLESETTYRCFGSPRILRRADVSYIRPDRLPGERLPKGYVTIAPDLAVEVVSPTDKAENVEEKVIQYLAAGVHLVWIVYPQTRTVHVRRPDGTSTILGDDQQLSGEAVLPGFSCPIRELFPPMTDRPISKPTS